MTTQADQIDQLLETLRRDCLPAGGADLISAYVSKQRQALAQVHAELAAKPADDLAKACIERLIESGAENYLEHHFVFTIDGDDAARPATVTVQFKDRPSPHQLRLQAEEALARVEAERNALLQAAADIDRKDDARQLERDIAQAEQQKAQGAQAGEFQREERYMVIKLSKLADDQEGDISRREQIFRIAHFGRAKVECVVVESDWPEYEPTWEAIQARVTGQGAQVEDEREAFSNWAHEKGFCLDCAFFEEGNNFEDPDTRLAYEIWLARAALATPPAAQDDGGRAVGPTHPSVRGAEHGQ